MLSDWQGRLQADHPLIPPGRRIVGRHLPQKVAQAEINSRLFFSARPRL